MKYIAIYNVPIYNVAIQDHSYFNLDMPDQNSLSNRNVTNWFTNEW